MERISIELLEGVRDGVGESLAFVDGVAAGLGWARDAVEDALAEVYALQAQDAVDLQVQDYPALDGFEDVMYEVAVLDEDGDDAYLMGVFFEEGEASAVASREAYESGSLVMLRVLSGDEEEVVGTMVFGGEF
jgi:hypothetical protein